MNDRAKRALATGVVTLAGSALLRRSRLLRLTVTGAAVAAAYAKLGRREPTWHQVPPEAPEPPR